MRPDLLDVLVCPSCRGTLALHAFRGGAGDEVEEGLLVCRSCAAPYPVTEGVPRMLPNAFRQQPAFARTFARELSGLSFRAPGREAVRGFERLHRLTARAFGYEWNTYRTTSYEEDVLTLFWLTGADAGLYQRFPLTDVFSYYPTRQEIAAIDPSILKGARVLEVGCGMGKYLKVAAEHARRVVGLDLSDAVRRARRETLALGNVEVVQGDILSCPLREGSMDFVYSVGVLHHTPDAHQAFLRSASLVRPGGSLAVWLYPQDANTSPEARRIHRLQDEILRPITCRMPPRLLRVFAAVLGRLTFVRDAYAERYRATGSRFAYRVAMAAGALAVGRHKEPEIAAFLNFDWYSPQYRSYHTEDELRVWYGEAGFAPPAILPQRVSGIGRRPAQLQQAG